MPEEDYLRLGRPETWSTPTAERVAAAHSLLETHERVNVPEPACRRCLWSWPCPDVQWARATLQRAKSATQQ